MNVETITGVKLYCYSEHGNDPHEVVLVLDEEDTWRWERVRERDGRVGRYEYGSFVEVTDQVTGRCYEVATAPCGAGCHCAAIAKLKEEE